MGSSVKGTDGDDVLPEGAVRVARLHCRQMELRTMLVSTLGQIVVEGGGEVLEKGRSDRTKKSAEVRGERCRVGSQAYSRSFHSVS